MHRLVTVVIVIIALAAAFAASEVRPTGGYLQAVREVEEALPACEESLQSIDVSSLSIQYREGKLVDRAKSRGLQYIQIIRRSLDEAKKRPTLRDTVFLVSTLRGLEAALDSLIVLLDNAKTVQSQAALEKASIWAAAVDAAITPFSKAINSFDTQAMSFAQTVDAMIEQCSR